MALALPAQPNSAEDTVRHLFELGYVDPDVVAAREGTLRRELEAEFQQALKSFERGDLQEALDRFEKLAADDPNWVAPRQLLAEIHYRLGDLPRAEKQLEWLTLHAVEHPRLALIAGAIALARRDMSEALEGLKYAASTDPNLPSVHTLLGATLVRLGRLTEAQHAFERAIKQHVTDAQALDGMAGIHLRKSNFADAAGAALEALDQDMQLFRAHYHLGIALAHLDRPDDAITAFETSAKVNANNAAPFRWLARVAEEQLGDADRARQYLERGIEIARRRVLARRQSART